MEKRGDMSSVRHSWLRNQRQILRPNLSLNAFVCILVQSLRKFPLSHESCAAHFVPGGSLLAPVAAPGFAEHGTENALVVLPSAERRVRYGPIFTTILGERFVTECRTFFLELDQASAKDSRVVA